MSSRELPSGPAAPAGVDAVDVQAVARILLLPSLTSAVVAPIAEVLRKLGAAEAVLRRPADAVDSRVLDRVVRPLGENISLALRHGRQLVWQGTDAFAFTSAWAWSAAAETALRGWPDRERDGELSRYFPAADAAEAAEYAGQARVHRLAAELRLGKLYPELRVLQDDNPDRTPLPLHRFVELMPLVAEHPRGQNWASGRPESLHPRQARKQADLTKGIERAVWETPMAASPHDRLLGECRRLVAAVPWMGVDDEARTAVHNAVRALSVLSPTQARRLNAVQRSVYSVSHGVMSGPLQLVSELPGQLGRAYARAVVASFDESRRSPFVRAPRFAPTSDAVPGRRSGGAGSQAAAQRGLPPAPDKPLR